MNVLIEIDICVYQIFSFQNSSTDTSWPSNSSSTSSSSAASSPSSEVAAVTERVCLVPRLGIGARLASRSASQTLGRKEGIVRLTVSLSLFRPDKFLLSCTELNLNKQLERKIFENEIVTPKQVCALVSSSRKVKRNVWLEKSIS